VKRNAIVDKTVAKKEKGMREKARNRKQRTHCKLSFTILELFKFYDKRFSCCTKNKIEIDSPR